MTDTDHSILAPSSAARAVQCPGSVLAEHGPLALPDDDGIEAMEGTAAHWAGAQMIEGVIPQVGDKAPNGVTLTVAILDEAELWYRDVRKVCIEWGIDPTTVDVEKRVRIAGVHPEHGWGSLDARAWALRSDYVHLFLWDFKRGHRFVDEHENWQLMDYVRGSLEERRGLDDQRVMVHMRIVQPRAYGHAPVREWLIGAPLLRAYWNIRTNRVEEALAPNPPFKPGEECRDCKVRHACDALHATGASIMDVTNRAQPHALPPEAIGWELKYVKHSLTLLKAIESGLDQQANHLLRKGPVPGVALRASEGRTNWTVPAPQVIALARMFKVDASKPPEAITPLQAIARGVPEAMVKGLSKATPGALKVTIDDGTLARRVGFGT
jgi:hypothetical protein